MRKNTLWFVYVVGLILWVLPGYEVTAATNSSVTDESEWNVTSFQVQLLDHRGGSGDIQIDQNGWIHLGANHMDGGDIQYEVEVGRLTNEDIVEVWVDGYSTSNALDVGPTIFIGTGKNRYEQMTRLTGDAWRPFVFRFADEDVYGDVTDPSNRNESWRTRYPSAKYEVRRIDKSPEDLLDRNVLPVRISITGVEDFILKRLEVVVYQAKASWGREGIYIVNVQPYTVRQGDLVTLGLNQALPSEQAVEFYLIDTAGRELKIAPRALNAEQNKVGFYADNYLFSQPGQYQVKLIDRTDPNQPRVDSERFEYVRSQVQMVPTARPTPPVACPEFECGQTGYLLPGYPSMNIPSAGLPPVPSMYVAPMPMPVAPVPQMIAPQPVVRGGYTVQIGAFQSQSVANALRDRLLRNGYDAYISESVQAGKRLYRVRVGRYADKASAQQDATRLRRSGYDTWVADLS
jgi:cell division protein FtsN